MKRLYNKIHFLLLFPFFLFLFNSNAFAQLQVTPNSTAQQLVDVLIGGGVTVTNPFYYGAPQSRGIFTTGPNPTNLGLTAGIILSTGDVMDAPGPNTSSGTSTTNGTGSDPQLAALIPGYTIYDACYLEFDFIPEADTVEFRYVFASEEYPQFVNSSFNDVFGFFISGPNPSGGNYVFENIALIPGTTLPVTIDNVNHLVNTQYYVNNHAQGQGTIEYDGFTVVLTAWAHVIPCVPYSIKIAIGDAGDTAYDSAVFLEEYSFTANTVNITTEYISQTAIDTAAIRGCADALVTFSTAQNVSNDFTVHYDITGTAVNGVDYNTIPDSVVIPAGQNSASVLIEPIFTGLPDPIVNIVIKAQTSLCAGLDSTIIYILPNEYITTESIRDDTLVCDDSVDLWIEVEGGIPPYTYEWDNGAGTGNHVTVMPTQTTVYTVTVTDDCGQTHTDQITITVGMDYGSVSSDTLICTGGTATLTASGGSTYLWCTGATSETITVQPVQSTTYYVTIYDACDGVDSVTVNVQPLPMVNIKPGTQSICRGETISLVAGEGQSFSWSSSPSDPSISGHINQQAILASPNFTTTYTVEATDSLGCVNSATATVTLNPNPVASFFTNPKTANILEPVIDFFDNSMGAASWYWQLGDGSSYNVPSFQHVFADTGRYEVNLVVYNSYGCVDSTSGYVMVQPTFTIYIPSAFSPNDDLRNDVFYVYGEGIMDFELRIFDRWGKVIFRTDDINTGWDGRINNNPAPEGVYVYEVVYSDGLSKRRRVNGTVTLLR